MGSIHQRPCGFGRRERAPKRGRGNEGWLFPEDFHIAPVEWRISIAMLHTVLVELDGDVTQMDMGAMRIGNYRESISHEANEVIFRGTTATMLQVNLILPDGNMSVLWTGNTIHVDAKYTIAPERFSYWNQSPAFDRNVRTITITACGSRRHPISLWQANRWYMVRFEEHFSAIIMPREMYYPLKLSFMRSFMESILPNRPSPVSSRSSNSSDRRSPSIVSYESPRGPPTSPHTPEMPHSSNQ